MLPFGVTIPAAVPQRAEIPEGLMNNPVYQTVEEEVRVNRLHKQCLPFMIF
jgi:hypothetical protein